jgi:acyl-CoA thioester hydrolase
MSDNHRLLADYPVVAVYHVVWGDQDAFGHVNNLAYLKWCESVRVDYLRQIDMWPELPPRGVGPILASIKCDYKRQLNYPDVIEVGARISRIGNSSMRMDHRVVSRTLDAVVAEVESVLVLLDYKTCRTVTIPGGIREAVGALEGRVLAHP